MRDALGPGTVLGYCTNVHAGTSLAEVRENLARYAVGVKRQVCPDQPMGVGLWFGAEAARKLGEPGELETFRAFLEDNALLAYTVNGFPYGGFHDQTVKHRVYGPDWTTQAREDFTTQLIDGLAGLLPEATEGSISTLPLGWPGMFGDDQAVSEASLARAAARLRNVVGHLVKVHEQTGALIHVDLEPEPGCVLDTAKDMVWFFENYLFSGWSGLSGASGSAPSAAASAQAQAVTETQIRRHLRICHDICHSAVMFEPQAEALATYRAAGIGLGKVQLSSAIDLPLSDLDPASGQAALDQLRGFCEPRYLHQTTVRDRQGAQRFHTDLPQALDAESIHHAPDDHWRVHFHVPVYLERFNHLRTTRNQLHELLSALGPEDQVNHFEIETYAWSVLPRELQVRDLAQGIAREMQWMMRPAP